MVWWGRGGRRGQVERVKEREERIGLTEYPLCVYMYMCAYTCVELMGCLPLARLVCTM